MVLSNGYLSVAFKLQEAAEMGHQDVRRRLSDQLNDMTRGSGDYAYYVDHTGDGATGDVIYSKNGDLRKASYETGEVGGKATCNIDDEGSSNVIPCTTYQEEADEDDHYAGMEESFRAAKLYSALPLYERFISKGERSNADEGSFAGKGKSFPILKPGDVSAAVHAMGRAGTGNYGMAQLKANIIRIAKAKGWESSLPKAWRNGGDTKEAAKHEATDGTLNLTESANTLETIVLKEAKSDYEIKLIAPGKGSSAFYPAEVLKRDGPKVFGAGTHVYLNHPTGAEEAARPEGDVKNLAGVLTTAAAYSESHVKGPGLYARMKVFADHGQLVEEKAPHVGMSIRASGIAESGKTKDGVPVLKELTSAESVDVVTRAGAGGMILTESARDANQPKESEMENADVTKLQEALAQSIAKIDAREARVAAKEIAVEALEGLALPKEAKADIITRSLEAIVLKDGALDETKFAETLKTETTRVAALISAVTGSGRVVGMGPSGGLTFSEATTNADPKEERRRLKEAKRQNEALRESEESVFTGLMGNSAAAKFAVNKGQAA